MELGVKCRDVDSSQREFVSRQLVGRSSVCAWRLIVLVLIVVSSSGELWKSGGENLDLSYGSFKSELKTKEQGQTTDRG